MSCVFTCQLHPHQAAIVPDQLTNTVPEQEGGIAQQLQNMMEHMQTFWEWEQKREGEHELGRFLFFFGQNRIRGDIIQSTQEWEYLQYLEQKEEKQTVTFDFYISFFLQWILPVLRSGMTCSIVATVNWAKVSCCNCSSRTSSTPRSGSSELATFAGDWGICLGACTAAPPLCELPLDE